MQHFAQQASIMAATPTSQSLLSTHYPQQSIIHSAQTTNSNTSSNQQTNANSLYHPTYYVSKREALFFLFIEEFCSLSFKPPVFPAATPFYMTYPATAPMLSTQPNPYMNGNLVQQQEHAQLLQNAPVAVETVHLYVPNTVIGAIIGSKGLFIKSIIKNSNASVKVTEVVESRSIEMDDCRWHPSAQMKIKRKSSIAKWRSQAHRKLNGRVSIISTIKFGKKVTPVMMKFDFERRFSFRPH